jgi:hypothetical protein
MTKAHEPTSRRKAIAGSVSALYRARNSDERFFDRIKNCRRDTIRQARRQLPCLRRACIHSAMLAARYESAP